MMKEEQMKKLIESHYKEDLDGKDAWNGITVLPQKNPEKAVIIVR